MPIIAKIHLPQSLALFAELTQLIGKSYPDAKMSQVGEWLIFTDPVGADPLEE
jgi:hypothetical protein